MDEIEIPKEIQRWNWGAFFFTPLWCLCHRLWLGFFLCFIPVVGFFNPFIMGAKGNKKAWLKSQNRNIESFLKRQRYWAVAGIAIWSSIILICIGLFVYHLHTGIKLALVVSNRNQLMVDYFGDQIRKNSFFVANSSVSKDDTGTLSIKIPVKGTKNSGELQFCWEPREEDLVATDISYFSNDGSIEVIADSALLLSSYSKRLPYTKTRLERILDIIIKEKKGDVLFLRSDNTRASLKASAVTSDDVVNFKLSYTLGYKDGNREVYTATELLDEEDVIELFTSYASGIDAHINTLEWSPSSISNKI